MDGSIELSHGAGGPESRAFIRNVFLHALKASGPEEDAAIIADGAYAFTTDGFVVDPPRFPGGDIGKLAVCGTVNDLAMRGARAVWISASWVLPEGMALDEVQNYARSLGETAAQVGAVVVAGDTKVLPAGDLRGPIIATAGVGVVEYQSSLMNVAAGDVLIVTRSIGEHGAALLAVREGLFVDNLPPSDCTPLWNVVSGAFQAGAHFARDTTRGGLTSVLHEIAESGPFTVAIDVESVPVDPAVKELCDVLGLSAMGLAAEGCAVVATRPALVADLLAELRQLDESSSAVVIGSVQAGAARVLCSEAGREFLLSEVAANFPRLC